MFLTLRKVLYLLLSIGSVGGALLAAAGLFTTLGLFIVAVWTGEWAAAGTVFMMMLMFAAGVAGPVWILITVLALPDPPHPTRRALTGLLLASILAAGGVLTDMLFPEVGEYSGSKTPIILFLMPMLVGCALIAELWVPVWRDRRRGEEGSAST
ncbi:MAG: hypothetical protein ACREUE_01315 [Panacagrimonas sp.]